MIETMKKRLKSKTYRVNLLMVILGILEVNFHLIKESFGDSSGWVFIGIAVTYAVLRELTKVPLSEK